MPTGSPSSNTDVDLRATSRSAPGGDGQVRVIKYMVIAQIYLCLSLIGFVWGPLHLPVRNLGTVIGFALLYQLAFAVGYVVSALRVASASPGLDRGLPPRLPLGLSRSAWNWTFLIVSLCSIGLSLSTLASPAGSVEMAGLLESLTRGITDPGAAYVDNQLASTDGSITAKLTTAFAIIVLPVNTIALLHWNSIPGRIKLLVALDLLLQAGVWVARGQNFGLFKVLSLIAVVMLLKRHLAREGVGTHRRRIVPLVAIAALLLGYFTFSTTDRFKNSLPSHIASIPINYDSPLVAFVPEFAQFGLVLVFAYLSQGYFGLSRIFDMEHQTTYGAGTSSFVMDNLESTFGLSLESRTYMFRMAGTWDKDENWHTAYAWVANDVGSVGVAGVMVFFGWVLARVVHRSLEGSLLAAVLLPSLVLSVLFLPANTAVLSNPLSAGPVLVWGTVFVLREISSGSDRTSRRARRMAVASSRAVSRTGSKS